MFLYLNFPDKLLFFQYCQSSFNRHLAFVENFCQCFNCKVNEHMSEIDGSRFAFDIYLVKCCNSDEKVHKNNWYSRIHRHMQSQ